MKNIKKILRSENVYVNPDVEVTVVAEEKTRWRKWSVGLLSGSIVMK